MNPKDPDMSRALLAAAAAAGHRPGPARLPGAVPVALTAALLAGLLALGGCAHPVAGAEAPPPPPALPAPSADPLIRSNERAADELVAAWRQAGFGSAETVLVATVVPLDNLKAASPLGRLVAEQVAGRLAQHGLGVKELRLREGVVIRADQGELLLSREVAELARQHQAHAALVGTYTRSREATRISLRLVRLDDARVIAASNYAVAVDEQSDALRRPAEPEAASPGRGTLYDAIREYDRRRPALR